MKRMTPPWVTIFRHILLCIALSHSTVATALEHEAAPLNEEAVRHAFYLGLNDRSGMTRYGDFAFHAFGRNVFMVGSDKDGLVTEELTCLLCTPEETLSAARSFGASIQAKARGEKPSMLNIDTALEGSVTVDGVPVAPLAGSHAIEAGEHEVILVNGGPPRRARISTTPGAATDISSVDATELDERRIMRVRWAVASSGIGIALAAVGGVLLALSDDCVSVKKKCDRSYGEGIRPSGIGLIAAGAVLQGVMIWLLLPRSAGEER